MRLLLFFLLVSCGESQTNAPPPIPVNLGEVIAAQETTVGTVNGKPLGDRCVRDLMTEMTQEKALEKCVDFELLAQEAEKQELNNTPETRRRYRQALVSAMLRNFAAQAKGVENLGIGAFQQTYRELKALKQKGIPDYFDHEEVRGAFYGRIKTIETKAALKSAVQRLTFTKIQLRDEESYFNFGTIVPSWHAMSDYEKGFIKSWYPGCSLPQNTLEYLESNWDDEKTMREAADESEKIARNKQVQLARIDETIKTMCASPGLQVVTPDEFDNVPIATKFALDRPTSRLGFAIYAAEGRPSSLTEKELEKKYAQLIKNAETNHNNEAKRRINIAYRALQGQEELNVYDLKTAIAEVAGDFDTEVRNFVMSPRKGKLEENFANALFGLKGEGEIAAPIETNWGWDIVGMHSLLPARTWSLEQAIPHLDEHYVFPVVHERTPTVWKKVQEQIPVDGPHRKAANSWYGELRKENGISVQINGKLLTHLISAKNSK